MKDNIKYFVFKIKYSELEISCTSVYSDFRQSTTKQTLAKQTSDTDLQEKKIRF